MIKGLVVLSVIFIIGSGILFVRAMINGIESMLNTVDWEEQET